MSLYLKIFFLFFVIFSFSSLNWDTRPMIIIQIERQCHSWLNGEFPLADSIDRWWTYNTCGTIVKSALTIVRSDKDYIGSFVLHPECTPALPGCNLIRFVWWEWKWESRRAALDVFLLSFIGTSLGFLHSKRHSLQFQWKYFECLLRDNAHFIAYIHFLSFLFKHQMCPRHLTKLFTLRLDRFYRLRWGAAECLPSLAIPISTRTDRSANISELSMDHNHHDHQHHAPMPKATTTMKMNHAHHHSLPNSTQAMMSMHHDHDHDQHAGHGSHSMMSVSA